MSKKRSAYISDDPSLLEEWDFSKNTDKTPQTTTKHSNKHVWWTCQRGHSYQSPPGRRAMGEGCPYCSGRLATEGENDLATVRPEIAAQWNYPKNYPLLPTQVKPQSGKSVWWVCEKGHEYKDTLAHRFAGRGCPYCSNRRVLAGFNDLATVRPDLVPEWHPTKNGDLLPSMVVAGSHLRAWWLCSACGHEWSTQIMKRLGCPKCSQKRTTSFPEQAIFFYISQSYPDSVNGYKFKGIEFDVYIPSLSTAIEYDGVFYHKARRVVDKDLKKDEMCKQNNISLIRFRDPKLPKTPYAHIIECVDSYRDDNLQNALLELFDYLNPSCLPDINIKRDGAEILAKSQQYHLQDNISVLFPEISAQWHYEKNYPLTPNYFTPRSSRKVWWKCEKGHEWQAVIGSRITCGCPFCSGHRALQGENDLATVKPEIAAEWNFEKNHPLTPQNVTAFSNRRVWWKCSDCGYEWQTSPANRDNALCRKCNVKLSGLKIRAKAAENNSLCERFPEIAAQWHPTKNGFLTAQDFSASSCFSPWWICEKGHEWQSIIGNRTKDHLGCPYCGNQKVLPGFNDLKSQFPDIAKDWHPTKNENSTPENFTPGSSKKIWWVCENGHEYLCTIRERVRGRGCPVCKK